MGAHVRGAVLGAAAALGVLVGVGACDPTDSDDFFADVVDAGDEAFAHRAVSFVWGRHARSIHEVEALVELIEATDRSTVVAAMAGTPEGRARWQAALLDLLSVPRIGHLSSRHCHGDLTAAATSPDLAAFVRDHGPRDQPEIAPWTVADLVASALLLDDVTSVFRVHLMTSFSRQRPLQTLAEEISERQVTGEVFGKTFIGRQFECMPCHNSAFSVTGSDDPDADRTWELGGLHERALFGADDGGDPDLFWAYFRRYGVLAEYVHTSQVDWYEPSPDRGCWAAFRGGCNGCDCEDEVLDEAPDCADVWSPECVELCTEAGGCADPVLVQPWGVSADDCGRFLTPDAFFDDLVFEEAFFITRGDAQASVWDLVPHLREGVDALRSGGPTIAADGTMPGSQAMAHLTVANLVDRVWAEAFGARLTLGHGFPRNEHQRAVLEALVDRHIAANFSFRDLLASVTEHPLFNASVPATLGPGDSPHHIPPVLDPWSVDREATDQQGNSFGDLIHRRDGRALIRSLYGAMGWPEQLEFHGGDEGEETGAARLQESVGVYLKEALPGFRGVAVQSLLAWETAFGTCRDTVPRGWGCESNSEWGCPDCPCEAEVCAELPECCAPGRRWTPPCAARCAESEAGCRPPEEPPPDFIEQLVEAGRADGATLGDAVATLKDRLLADPRIESNNERVVLSRLLDGDLDAPLGEGADTQLRRACSVFIATPWFLLAGDPGSDRAGSPVPIPIGGTRDEWCETLADALFDGEVTCGE